MKFYYVNNSPDEYDNHEVHEDGCKWLGLVKNPTFLGEFESCFEAVTAAALPPFDFPPNKVDGCAHCSPECHSR